jgi:hypothetical protein
LSSWLYEINWQPKKLSPASLSTNVSGAWLILSDQGTVGQTVAELLEARGEKCIVSRQPQNSADDFQNLLP